MTTIPTSVGPYTILELLGKGGMGMVYRGRHKKTGERAAIKTVILPKKRLLQNIRREIHALTTIRHPGIVHIIESGSHEGLPWYAMNVIQGVSLSEFHRIDFYSQETNIERHNGKGEIQQITVTDAPGQRRFLWWTKTEELLPSEFMKMTGSQKIGGLPHAPISRDIDSELLTYDAARETLSEEKLLSILTIIRRLCAPLAYIHGEGIIHRDLKPDNIMVQANGFPIIVDFGLLSQFGGRISREYLHVEGVSAGTLHYMSPEQIRGEFVDARADLYSLGCILYELLTGSPPFRRKDVSEEIFAHLHGHIPLPSERVSGIPPKLDEIVFRLLAKEPADRYGYASDVALVLESLGAENGLTDSDVRPQPYLYRSGFTSRNAQLSELKMHLEDLKEKRGHIALISGESGVGKTRLAMEFGRIAAHEDVTVFIGECIEDSSGPMESLRKPLRALVDHCMEKGEQETVRIFGQRGKILSRIEPLILSLPEQNNLPEPIELSPDLARLRLFRSLENTFRAVSENETVLFILDDIHWADDLTIQFLKFLLEGKTIVTAGYLIIGTYRSDEVRGELKSLLDDELISPIQLNRLNEEGVADMLRNMLSLQDPVPRFSKFLFRNSEGNPFFVAEYLRTAIVENILRRDSNGLWHIGSQQHTTLEELDFERLTLPYSLKDLLGRRLKDLDSTTRHILEMVSVIGHDIDIALLREMSTSSEHELLTSIRLFMKRQILEQDERGNVRFVHDKIRDVVKERIDRNNVMHLHRKAAEGIEKLYPENLDSYNATLGYHWEIAGEIEAAKKCYLAAARSASSVYALDKADSLYQDYFTLVKKPSLESITARNDWALNILKVSGRLKEAFQEHHTALKEAQLTGEKVAEAATYKYIGIMHHILGQSEESQRAFEGSLHLYEQMGNLKGQALCLSDMGGLYKSRGEYDKARACYDRSLEFIRKADDKHNEGNIISNLASLFSIQGKIQEATTLFSEVLDIAHEFADIKMEGIVCGNLGICYIELGRLEKAKEMLDIALQISQETGNVSAEAHVLGSIAILYEHIGEINEAVCVLQQSLKIFKELGHKKFAAINLGNLGRIFQNQGKSDLAIITLEEALSIHQSINNRSGECHMLYYIGDHHDSTGNYDKARNYYNKSLSVALTIENTLYQGIVSLALARLDRTQKADFTKAEERLVFSEKKFSELGRKFDLVYLYCEKGFLALAKAENARPFLQKARDLADETDSIMIKNIDELQKCIELFEEGELDLLYRGERIQSLPPKIQQELRGNS